MFTDLYERLTSRKFLLTLAALITLAANRQWTQLVAALVGYLGVEGTSDIVKAVKGR